MSVAIILAGHGSQISADTAGVVWSLVDRLRQWGIADEVTACFWKEQAHYHEVLESVIAETIVVVPVFTAQGFFTKQIIPSEMGLSGILTEQNGRQIHYTRTLGEHPYVGEILRTRVMSMLALAELNPDETVVAVIGHGTHRDRDSRSATQFYTAQLQAESLVQNVIDAYLDDDPSIASIYERTDAKHIIAVPFFLARGSHVMEDVPNALGIVANGQPSLVHDRTVYYTDPLGTDDSLGALVLALIRETGVSLKQPHDAGLWSGFPQVGADVLLDALEQGQFHFSELRVTHATIEPLDNVDIPVNITTPIQLRQIVREQDSFRHLASTKGLPRGWRVSLTDRTQAVAVIETVYPGALASWAQHQRGQFRAESLGQALERQKGMFRDLIGIAADIVDDGVAQVCSDCVKEPAWHGVVVAKGAIPCKSPCNFWLSHLKEIAII